MTACPRFSRRCTQGGEEATLAIEGELGLGNEHKVHFLHGQGGAGGDEAGLAAHELDDAHAEGTAESFGVRALNGLRGLGHGGLEAKGLLDEADVVVDGLGDADDGDFEVAPRHFLEDGAPGFHGAVAADDEEHVDVAALQCVDDLGRDPAALREEPSTVPPKRWMSLTLSGVSSM